MNKIDKKKEQGLATKQDITVAAEAVFFEKGAAATTIEQVAGRANVTRGAVYWHFKNKNELLEQIVDKAVVPLLDSFRTALEGTPNASIDHLHDASRQTILTIARSSDYKRRLAITLLKCEYTEEFQYLIDKHALYHEEVREILATYLKKIEVRTSALSKTPEVIAEAFLFYIMGMLTQFFKEPDKVNLERHVTVFLDIFFLSLINPRVPIEGRTSL